MRKGIQQKGKVLEASRQANGKTYRVKVYGLLRNKVYIYNIGPPCKAQGTSRKMGRKTLKESERQRTGVIRRHLGMTVRACCIQKLTAAMVVCIPSSQSTFWHGWGDTQKPPPRSHHPLMPAKGNRLVFFRDVIPGRLTTLHTHMRSSILKES